MAFEHASAPATTPKASDAAGRDRVMIGPFTFGAKMLWLGFFLFLGLFSAAAVAALGLLQTTLNWTPSRTQGRTLSFSVLLLVAAGMVALHAPAIAYLPLAAAWLGSAAFWIDPREGNVALLVLGEITWISFGAIVGSWAIVLCAGLAACILIVRPWFQSHTTLMMRALSPSMA